ncbi:N-acetylmuramoyl-L-alanine amidase [Listeria sp. PSOL-1]|uniref:SH3 domain-containing protein n=1 Tax=Listeria sp. PSOL-1 TaxID=1844999 RepID=UPI0013CF7742|nr:N-acetylmuramoyl-L-alanine amidase [Listeria sp. PSOL-1]
MFKKNLLKCAFFLGIIGIFFWVNINQVSAKDDSQGIDANEILNNKVDEKVYTPRIQSEKERKENQAKPTTEEASTIRAFFSSITLPEYSSTPSTTSLSNLNQTIINKNFATPQIEKQLKNFDRFPYADGVGKPRGIVIHETANDNSTIQSEINYMTNNWQNAFVQTFVDRNQVIEIHPTDYASWGAGPKANPYFVQVELVREKTANNFYHSIYNDAYYAAYILKKYNLVPTNAHNSGSGTVWSHDAVSRYLGGTTHGDPVGYFARWNYTFNEFFQLVQYMYGRIDVSTTYYASSPINLRSDANWSSSIAAKINIGESMKVDPSKAKNGWAYVNYKGTIGYIPYTYIQKENTFQKVYAKDKLNLRSDAKWDSSVSGVVPAGQAITSNGAKAKNGWAYVTYVTSNGNISGYIPSAYFQTTNPLKTYYGKNDLNLRADSKWDASTTVTVPVGKAVTVNTALSKNGWWHITYNGKIGYLPGDYLQETNPIKKYYGKDLLNLRADSNWDSKVVVAVPTGEVVTVNTALTKNNWWYIIYKGVSGYLPGGYLQETNPIRYAYAKDLLNVRSDSNWDSNVSVVVSAGEKVQINTAKEKNDWAYMSYNGKGGYLPEGYVASTNPYTTYYAINAINLRKDSNWDSGVVGVIPAKAKVAVDLSKTKNGWLYVTYNTIKGYIPEVYLSK